jgi:hypothetical protein
MIIELTKSGIVGQILTNSLQIFKIIVRLLRKRIVLALIFTLSFTYCLLSLIRDRNHVKSMSANLYEYESDVDIDQFHIRLKLNESIQQNLNLNQDMNNDNNGSGLKCRNSIQGKVLIADDRGFVCHRKDVLLTGCCDETNTNTKLYSCDTCQVCIHLHINSIHNTIYNTIFDIIE